MDPADPAEAAASKGQSDGRSPRRIACMRCRRRKKRCDRALPVCRECSKTGSECVQVGVKTHGPMTTVPTAFLQQLESRITAMQQKCRDAGLDVDDTQIQHEESSYPSPFENISEDFPNSFTDNREATRVHREDNRMGNAAPSQANDISVKSPFVGADLGASTSNTYSTPQPVCELPTTTLHHRRESFQPLLPTFNDSRLPHDLSSIGDDWMDHYAYNYFRHAQPQWSFLDETTWRMYYRAWTTGSQRLEEAQIFILQLVLAVGALLSSSYRQDCPHLIHASRLHETAIQRYLGAITQHSSPLTRTQASLLMLIYSWHDSSHNVVPSSIMLVLLNCASLIDRIMAEDAAGEGTDTDHLLWRPCVMSCHIINEIVSSAWSYPQNLLFETLDNNIFQYTSTMKPEPNGSDFYERLFQLRCIQSKIRHTDKKLRRLDPSDPFRGSCRLRLKDELQGWKASVQAFTSSIPPDNVVYHEPQSLLKLYDYGLSILMQENLSIMSVEDVGQLIECCSEACRTFRTSQRTHPLMYWTWTALMYQFRLGIMLIYCYFTTPRTLQTPVFSFETTLAGIESCRQTLMGFSERWPKSLVYLSTFQLLTRKTFEDPYIEAVSNSATLETASGMMQCLTSGSSREWTTTMEAMITELKLQHVHQAVVGLIKDMMDRASAENFNIEAMDFAPNLPLGSLDLFSFCVPT